MKKLLIFALCLLGIYNARAEMLKASEILIISKKSLLALQ